MSEFKLIEEIKKLSIAQIWGDTILEWELIEIKKIEQPESCLCGHYPIVELCTIRNINNGNTTVVGNCCVKKFMRIKSDKIFKGIDSIQKDNNKSLNSDALEFYFSKGVINEWERTFYLNIHKKRVLTTNQFNKKIQINSKILAFQNK